MKPIHDLHGSCIPAEFSQSDCISSTFYVNGKNYELDVWRISPFGVEYIAAHHGHVYLSDCIAIGTKVDVKIVMGRKINEFCGVVLSRSFEEKGRQLLSVRFFSKRRESLEPAAKESMSLVCSHVYSPRGVTPNPLLFNDYIHFSIMNYSNGVFKIRTSLRNKMLIKGLSFKAMVSFPMVGQSEAFFTVKWVDLDSDELGNEYLILGSEISRDSDEFMSIFGQYLLLFCEGSKTDSLRLEGFSFKENFPGLDMEYAKTEEEYHEVLTSRKLAYSGQKKLDGSNLISDYGDAFDSRARILAIKHHDQVIASARIMFHGDGDHIEQDQFVSIPVDFPSKQNSMECTLVSVHPDYQSTDILMHIFRFICLACIQANRRYVIANATHDLLLIYKSMGVIPTDLKFFHKKFGDSERVIFIGDIHSIIKGRKVNPIKWNIYFKNLMPHLEKEVSFQLNEVDKLRVGVYKLLYPIALILKNIKIKLGRRGLL